MDTAAVLFGEQVPLVQAQYLMLSALRVNALFPFLPSLAGCGPALAAAEGSRGAAPHPTALVLL